MTKPLIQIDHEIREMNDDEFEQYEIEQTKYQAELAQAKAQAAAKAALLNRLGITADEAKLLLS